MNGYNFTDRVRKVLQMAREEAARLHHDYVGTEHILLGLLREGEGVAVAVLTNLNVDLSELQKTIEGATTKGKPTASAGPDLPYTSRAKKVLEFSMAEARELDHAYVGTEHLLLGLLREETGIAAQVLTDVGANLELVRAETLRLLGTRAHSPTIGRQSSPDSPRESRRMHYGFVVRASRVRLLGGILFALSGAEALWYAPGVFGKAVGLLGAFGGLLMIAFWLTDAL